MTTITFFKNNSGFYGFHETGHAGFADEGEDIICSAISAMTMLVMNTIEVVYDIRTDYKIDDETAEVTCKCNIDKLEDKLKFAISGLFEGYFVQLNDMAEEYYEYIEVKLIEK